jgi:hypothetical protein
MVGDADFFILSLLNMMMLWRRRVFGFLSGPGGVKSISTFGEQRAKDKKGHSGAPFCGKVLCETPKIAFSHPPPAICH